MPWGPSKPRLSKALDRIRANLRHQFGQSNSYSAFNGSTACAHVCLQHMAYIWLGKRYTIDQISRMAGYYRERNSNGDPRGLNAAEFQRVITYLKLPYRIVWGYPATDLVRASNMGPVFYGNRYGSEPSWKGKTYNGVRATSPFAAVAGRTQLTGFNNGRHAVLLLGYRTFLDAAGKISRYWAFRFDPNHHSGSRPERPVYHRISTTQVAKEYNDYHTKLGNRLYAAIPTRNLPT